MPVKVKASIGTVKYYTEVVAGENTLITDEPKNFGGKNKGFNPYEILATSIASCTAATLRMYIDKKGWDIPKVEVSVTLDNFPITKNAIFTREINFECLSLDAEARDKLFEIAEACPVHKLLTNNIEINTKILE